MLVAFLNPKLWFGANKAALLEKVILTLLVTFDHVFLALIWKSMQKPYIQTPRSFR